MSHLLSLWGARARSKEESLARHTERTGVPILNLARSLKLITDRLINFLEQLISIMSYRTEQHSKSAKFMCSFYFNLENVITYPVYKIELAEDA